MSRVLVINPNSTVAVTEGIDRALAPLRMAGGPELVAVTLSEGPAGIQTQRDVDGVIGPLCKMIGARALDRGGDCDAFVIACYSDPGLYSARELTTMPVLGISECGILTALTLGQRFGVIAILQQSIPRHLRYVASLGLSSRLAGELAVDLQVLELADRVRTGARMIETGRRLVTECGADVIVMGCAGMAQYRDELQEELGIPVVEPTLAAASMAIGRVRLGWAAKRKPGGR